MDKKERIHIDTLLIYTLWYEFSNNFDVQSDFGKILWWNFDQNTRVQGA